MEFIRYVKSVSQKTESLNIQSGCLFQQTESE